MYYRNNRTGAFVVATPNYAGIAIRRPLQNPASGYSLWPIADRPFAVCAPHLPYFVTPQELADRVGSLVKISGARTVLDVCECVEHVLEAAPCSEDTERKLAEEAIDGLAKQIGQFVTIYKTDLQNQDAFLDDENIVLEASQMAPLSYVRGWGWGHGDLTKAKLSTEYRNHTWHALANALRKFDIGPNVLDRLCNLVFDQIMSISLSVHAKRFIVTGFFRQDVKVASVDFDGRFCGRSKTSISEYGSPCANQPSFFVDAGSCFEVARFAEGQGHDAHESAKASSIQLLDQLDNEHMDQLGTWRDLKELQPTPTDVATRALKAVEFNGFGLFGTPFHEIVMDLGPEALLEAMHALCAVGDLQDRLLGINEPAWTETLVLGPEGVTTRSQ